MSNEKPSPFCFSYSTKAPAFMFGPPEPPEINPADLDDLAALEAKAWHEYYRLGRRNLAQLTRLPIAELDDDCRAIGRLPDDPPANLVRVFLLVRLITFHPSSIYYARPELFRQLGPPVAALWLHLSRDNLAGPHSFGSTQIVRLTIAPNNPHQHAIVAACAGFAANLLPGFLPPEWPAPGGPRPVTLYLPEEPQPTQLAADFLAQHFTEAGFEPNAYADRRPGRLYVFANGLAGLGLRQTTETNPGDHRP